MIWKRICPLLVCCCLFFSVWNFAQKLNYNQVEIDGLIEKGDSLYGINQDKEAQNYYKQAIYHSEKNNYSKGLAFGYYGLSKISWKQKNIDKSTEYLLLANKQPYAEKDPLIKSKINFSLGLNLHSIGMLNDALHFYKISHQYAEKIEDESQRNLHKSFCLVNIGDVYELTSKLDSAVYFYKKSFYGTQDNDTKLVSSSSLTDVYMKLNQADSAQKYYELAPTFLNELNEPSYGAIMGSLHGRYKFFKGDYEGAIEELRKLDEKQQDVNFNHLTYYKYLSDAYQKIGKSDSSNFFLKKYLEASEDLQEQNNTTLLYNKRVPKLIYSELHQQETKSYKWIWGILLIAVLISLVSIYLVFQQRKKLKEKQEETSVLKKQLNSAFEEITELAKSNSPNFLTRFREVYPEFFEALLEIEPDLSNSELQLAAYLKLDFSTKEISDYNFVSVRTVQNRRYRLRKKLNLDAKIDLNVWLQNLTPIPSSKEISKS